MAPTSSSGLTSLCLACFSSILDASSPSPSDEKYRPSFRTPCCSRPICRRCLDANPRLGAYCLHCQNPMSVVATPAEASKERREKEERYWSERRQVEDGDKFIIGDEDDDASTLAGTETTMDMTLDYRDAVRAGDGDDNPWCSQREPADGADTSSLPPAYDFDTPHPPEKTIPFSTESEGEKVGIKPPDNGRLAVHYLQPHDTLAGLALKYKLDGRHLALINHLPASTLTTTPSLLHTRPFLLLPPHIDPATSSSPVPLLSPAEQRLRQLIRRFQLQAKVPDWNVARAYIEVVLDGRRAEAAASCSSARLQSHIIDGAAAEEDDIRVGGEVEEAVGNWRTDEEWERRDKGKSTATRSRIGGFGPWTRGERGVAMTMG